MNYTNFCENNTSDFNDDMMDGDTGNKILKIIFIFFYATLNHSLLGENPKIEVEIKMDFLMLCSFCSCRNLHSKSAFTSNS